MRGERETICICNIYFLFLVQIADLAPAAQPTQTPKKGRGKRVSTAVLENSGSENEGETPTKKKQKEILQ